MGVIRSKNKHDVVFVVLKKETLQSCRKTRSIFPEYNAIHSCIYLFINGVCLLCTRLEESGEHKRQCPSPQVDGLGRKRKVEQ